MLLLFTLTIIHAFRELTALKSTRHVGTDKGKLSEN